MQPTPLSIALLVTCVGLVKSQAWHRSTIHASRAGSVSIRPVQRSRLQVRADKGEEGGPAGRSKQAQAPEAG